MNLKTSMCIVMILAVSLTPATAAAQTEAYTGTHITFDTQSNAIIDYSIGGTTMVDSMAVQSKSKSEEQGIVTVGADLSTVTNVGGSSISVDSSTELKASLTTESGAELTTHDNERGILIVRSGGDAHYVTANISGSSSAQTDGSNRVVVTHDDGTKGAFIVIGDGEVTVNENGNVTSRIGSEGTLVFRSYQNERSDDDKQQEQLIADGTAAAEVYVTEKTDGSNEFATSVVSYSEDTTVEVTEQSQGTVTMTADRTSENGKIVLSTISENAIDTANNVEVTVDGNAATEASSYSELKTAANGGDTSKFMVKQASSASASADVLVAVNHFSQREVTIAEEGTSDQPNEDTDSSSTPGQPGFGIAAAIIALLSAALVAKYHS